MNEFVELLISVIPSLPNHLDQLIELLSANDALGYSGLFFSRTPELIKAYGNMLLKFSSCVEPTHYHKLIALFVPKDPSGIPILFDLMIKDQEQLVEAYCETALKLIDLLPEGERSAIRVDVLAAKNPLGMPAFNVKTHSQTMISTYNKVIGCLPVEEQVDLFSQFKDFTLSDSVEGYDSAFSA